MEVMPGITSEGIFWNMDGNTIDHQLVEAQVSDMRGMALCKDGIDEMEKVLPLIAMKIDHLIASFEKDHLAAAEWMGVSSMALPEMKRALKLASKELEFEPASPAERAYAQLRLKVLSERLMASGEDVSLASGTVRNERIMDADADHGATDLDIDDNDDDGDDDDDEMELFDTGPRVDNPVKSKEGMTIETMRITHELRFPTSEVSPLELLESLSDLGNGVATLRWLNEALAISQCGVRIARSLAQDQPQRYLGDLAPMLNTLAYCLSEAGQHDDAVNTCEEALAICRDCLQSWLATPWADSRNEGRLLSTPNLNLARTLEKLAGYLAVAGRQDEAIKVIEEAVPIIRDILDVPPHLSPPLSLCESLNNLAARLRDAGRVEEAIKTINQAVKIFRKLAGQYPAAFKPMLIRSLRDLTSCLDLTSRHAESLEASEEATALEQVVAN